MASKSLSSDVTWHTSPTRQIKSGATLTYSYSGLNVSVSFSATNYRPYSGHSDPAKALTDTIYVKVDGTSVGSASDSIAAGTSWSAGRSKSLTASGSTNVTAGSHTVSAWVYCSDGSDCSSSVGYPGRQLLSATINVPNPYKAFSLDYQSCTSIIKPGNPFKVKYKITKGTDNITDLHINLYNDNPRYCKHSYPRSKTTGSVQTAECNTYTDTSIDRYVAPGSKYPVTIYCSDGTTQKETGLKWLYTYQEPKVTGVSMSTPSPQNAITGNTYTLSGTNNKKWSDYENDFITQYRYKVGSGSYTDWANVGTATSWTRTAAQIRAMIPCNSSATESNDGQTLYVQFRRRNAKADWNSSAVTASSVVYYRPRVTVATNTIKYNLNNSRWYSS